MPGASMKKMIAGFGESRSGWQRTVFMRPSAVAISICRSIMHSLPYSCAPTPARLLLRAGADGNPRQIGARHRLDFEILRRRRHARQGLGKWHRRFGITLFGFVESHGIDARHHIVAKVGRLESPRLQALDYLFRARVDFQQPRCIALALAQAHRKRALTEPVHLLEKGAIGAAGKARRFLVHYAQRQEFVGFELRCVLLFLPSAVEPPQPARQTNDLTVS